MIGILEPTRKEKDDSPHTHTHIQILDVATFEAIESCERGGYTKLCEVGVSLLSRRTHTSSFGGAYLKKGNHEVMTSLFTL